MNFSKTSQTVLTTPLNAIMIRACFEPLFLYRSNFSLRKQRLGKGNEEEEYAAVPAREKRPEAGRRFKVKHCGR